MTDGIIIQTIFFSIILGSAGIVLSEKFRMPGIIFYFAMGILAGPSVTGLIVPKSLEGGLSIMITVFVSIILFEGGLSLNLKQISSLRSVLVKDIVLSVIVMVTVGFLTARFIAGLSWEVSIIFASLIVVTGPTVIKPVIRHIALSNRVKNFLNGEAVLIDAVGAILAIITLEFVLTRHEIFLSIAGFAGSLIVGAIFGLAFGFASRYIICKTRIIPPASNSFFVLGAALLSFACSEFVVPESGLLTVVIAGLVLSTMNYREKEKILNFKDQVTRIATSILFVLLSANFSIGLISQYFTEGLVVVFIIIIARFPVIFLSTHKEDFRLKEKLFISWLGPRGIIALSVASIASIKLVAAGIPKAETIEILVFMLISITVILQGLSARWIAARLKILVKGDRSIIIFGVSDITLMLADKWGVDRDGILFVDSNRKNCRMAEQRGFNTREGNALDPATYTGIDMDSFTSALAATANNEINILFCSFLRENYGIEYLYTMLNERASDELAEIIHNENIRLAFGTKSGGEETFSWDGFVSKMKDIFTLKKQKMRLLKVTCADFVKNSAGRYPLPEGVTIFLVVRNSTDLYVYHTSFEIRLNDELYVMSSDEGLEKLEAQICRPAAV